MNGSDLPGVLDEQVAYYRARAATYDDTYRRTGTYDRGVERNAAWLADLAQIEAALDALPLHGEVIELGAGTGFWTERLARRAAKVTALDAAPEMLHLARRRLGPDVDVEFGVVDLIREWTPHRTWDGLVACFFIEHVPDEHLDDLLSKAARSLRVGATVFIADGGVTRPTPGEIEQRELGGSTFRVVERRREPTELAAAFAKAGIDLVMRRVGTRFVVGTGTRR